jgi:hypothetical protein
MVGQFYLGTFPIAVVDGGDEGGLGGRNDLHRPRPAYCMGKGRGGKGSIRKFLYGRKVFFEQQHSEAMHACDRGLQYLIKL